MGDIGEKVDRGTKKVAGKVFEYANVGRKAAKAAKKGTDYRREASKSAFMQNQSERDHATQRLMDKSGGIIPTKAEVNEEMEKRWELRERGIRDNEVIDGALALSEEKVDNQLALEAGTDPEFATVQDALENDSQYAKDYAKLQKYNEEKEERGLLGAPGDVKDEFDKKYAKYGGSAAAEKHQDKKEKVEKRTMDQTAIAARIASEYSKADFKDEKKMSALQKTMSKEYSQQTGSSPEHSKKVVNRAITDAAKVKGVKAPNIPEEKTKEEKPKNEGKPKNEEKK